MSFFSIGDCIKFNIAFPQCNELVSQFIVKSENEIADQLETQEKELSEAELDIDKLMKSTKSALEEVELPSSSTSPPQEQDSE